jgi:hypothetical protein
MKGSEVENKSATPYSPKGNSQRPRKVEGYFSPPFSPFSLQPLWTLARTKGE